MNRREKDAVGRALGVYALWVAATYLLEGLPGTLVRPEAVGLRLAYALVANLAIGILLPLWAIRRMLAAGLGTSEAFGFSGLARTAASIVAGGAVGFGLFQASQPGPVHPLVVVNSFAQVWVVSVAEIVVCWGLVGATVRLALRDWSCAGAVMIAAFVASLLFGVYHFAHSPPFNEPKMVAFLTAIGFATSLWWFASRDVYGTAVFHNFFGVTGVLAALQAGGLVPEQPDLAIPLVVTAVVATIAVAWPGCAWIRCGRRQAPGA